MDADRRAALLAGARRLVPDLSPGRYKGQAGKVGVVGGCREYTGAPYFAAMAALRVGADLSHVFCTGGAATVIKSYSPELIVHPYLPSLDDHGEDLHPHRQQTLKDAAVEAIGAWLDRFDVLVIGPGLGRDDLALACVSEVAAQARRRGVPLVIDADGLWLVNQEPGLVQGYRRAVLTPNAAEFGRLAGRLGVDRGAPDALRRVAAALEGPVVVLKGAADAISDGEVEVHCDEEGSPRRAGGQGDVLSGTIAAYVAWAQRAAGVERGSLGEAGASPVEGVPPLVLAAYAGCATTRAAARAAFRARGRAMGAGDVIEQLGPVVDIWCPPHAAEVEAQRS
jgi:ATP-dependent NAD(P)H-hydrate dehydratase